MRCLIRVPSTRSVFDFGLHVAGKAAIPLAAEKAQDVLGGKGQRRKLQELLIEPAERGRTGEQQVGGELRLIDDPVNRGSGGAPGASSGLT